jgi:hypothetical protein
LVIKVFKEPKAAILIFTGDYLPANVLLHNKLREKTGLKNFLIFHKCAKKGDI